MKLSKARGTHHSVGLAAPICGCLLVRMLFRFGGLLGGGLLEPPLVRCALGIEPIDAHEPPHVPGMALKEDFRPAQVALLLTGSGGAQVGAQRMLPLELA